MKPLADNSNLDAEADDHQHAEIDKKPDVDEEAAVLQHLEVEGKPDSGVGEYPEHFHVKHLNPGVKVLLLAVEPLQEIGEKEKQ